MTTRPRRKPKVRQVAVDPAAVASFADGPLCGWLRPVPQGIVLADGSNRPPGICVAGALHQLPHRFLLLEAVDAALYVRHHLP